MLSWVNYVQFMHDKYENIIINMHQMYHESNNARSDNFDCPHLIQVMLLKEIWDEEQNGFHGNKKQTFWVRSACTT